MFLIEFFLLYQITPKKRFGKVDMTTPVLFEIIPIAATRYIDPIFFKYSQHIKNRKGKI